MLLLECTPQEIELKDTPNDNTHDSSYPSKKSKVEIGNAPNDNTHGSYRPSKKCIILTTAFFALLALASGLALGFGNKSSQTSSAMVMVAGGNDSRLHEIDHCTASSSSSSESRSSSSDSSSSSSIDIPVRLFADKSVVKSGTSNSGDADLSGFARDSTSFNDEHDDDLLFAIQLDDQVSRPQAQDGEKAEEEEGVDNSDRKVMEPLLRGRRQLGKGAEYMMSEWINDGHHSNNPRALQSKSSKSKSSPKKCANPRDICTSSTKSASKSSGSNSAKSSGSKSSKSGAAPTTCNTSSSMSKSSKSTSSNDTSSMSKSSKSTPSNDTPTRTVSAMDDRIAITEARSSFVDVLDNDVPVPAGLNLVITGIEIQPESGMCEVEVNNLGVQGVRYDLPEVGLELGTFTCVYQVCTNDDEEEVCDIAILTIDVVFLERVGTGSCLDDVVDGDTYDSITTQRGDTNTAQGCLSYCNSIPEFGTDGVGFQVRPVFNPIRDTCACLFNDGELPTVTDEFGMEFEVRNEFDNRDGTGPVVTSSNDDADEVCFSVDFELFPI